MRILNGFAALLSCASLDFSASAAASRPALDYVDPLIGTEGHGSQYGGMMPYTGVPFGSFQLVPMTRLNRVGQLSFNQADDTLLGFILTRQPAIWMGDWGEVRVPIEPARIESFRPAPYLGRIAAGGRTFEYTATMHAAWIRGDLNEIRLLDGYNANRDDENLGYPLPNFKGWRHVERKGRDLKIGVSLISLEDARRNMEAELGGKSFEAVVAETRAAWEECFSRVEIEAPDDVKTIFYTGLFHTLLFPREISERGRYYSAFDDRIHDGVAYSCYSLWDTYRAEHPWLALVAPERVDGMMQSLLQSYREGGWLPKWPNPGYTGIMTGSPAEIVLAEAWRKGFRGFDLGLAWEAVKKSAFTPQENDLSFRWEDRGAFGRTPETRAGLTDYMRLGYVACDHTAESVSRTLDFCLDDASAAVLARAAGDAASAAVLEARAKSYTNLWHAAKRRFLPRRSDGSWSDPKPGDYTECSDYTALWCVPHDVEGLCRLLGGADAMEKELDHYFDKVFFVPERGNRSIHGNEPSHHVAYLYAAIGRPAKTAQRVREIFTRCYSTDRKGFDGNEDCGQMSAWYLFSALGFYPVHPASGEYVIGAPQVQKATLHLVGASLRDARGRHGVPTLPGDRGNGKTLTVIATDLSRENKYVKSVTLNGVPVLNGRLRHEDIAKGGMLSFVMGPNP